jgi:hypothetical protein
MWALGVMKNILHIAAVLIVIVVGGLGVMKSTENLSSSFKVYADMDSSGLIEAGRIPNYLPRSAYEIDETHNIESKIVKIYFRYKPGDTQIARSSCRTETNIGDGILFVCEEGTLKLLNDGKVYFTNAPNDV